MQAIRPHLEAAQLALMEAAAQARVDQDRAVYGLSRGRIQPALHAASVVATINMISTLIDHILQGSNHDN